MCNVYFHDVENEVKTEKWLNENGLIYSKWFSNDGDVEFRVLIDRDVVLNDDEDNENYKMLEKMINDDLPENLKINIADYEYIILVCPKEV